MKNFIFVLLAVLLPATVFAVPTKIGFGTYSTAVNVSKSCTVVPVDIVSSSGSVPVVYEYIDKARTYTTTLTKSTTAASTFNNYSTVIANTNTIHIKCFNTVSGAALVNKMIFDSTTSQVFPITELFLKIK